MTADAQVHTLLRFGNVAAVHQLPAGLPRTCGLKYLLSIIMALTHAPTSCIHHVHHAITALHVPLDRNFGGCVVHVIVHWTGLAYAICHSDFSRVGR